MRGPRRLACELARGAEQRGVAGDDHACLAHGVAQRAHQILARRLLGIGDHENARARLGQARRRGPGTW